MESTPKTNADRGISLSSALWVMGCGFILAASGSFLAFERFGLPWWVLAVTLGVSVGLIVLCLEQFVVRPLDRLTRTLHAVSPEGDLQFPPVPSNLPAPTELRKLWRGLRVFQDRQSQVRLARQSGDVQLSMAQRQARVLLAAGRSMRPGTSLGETAPGLLRDLAAVAGLSAVYLVPLRKHCPVPVLGPTGTPEWAEALRSSGVGYWEEVFDQDHAVALSPTSLAPAWANGWSRRSLWVVPLAYHGRALGLLIGVPAGADRAFTREEQSLFEALAPMLAAGLHPPRWSSERKSRMEERRDELESAFENGQDDDDTAQSEEGRRRSRRRRHKQGA